MKKVTVHLIESNYLGDFYFTQDAVALARKHLEAGNYSKVEVEVFGGLVGEDAAEAVFELTNHPGLNGERKRKYGNGRSVSVGDMVEVDGVRWLCRPNGWLAV